MKILQRLLAMALCLALLFSMVPATQVSATTTSGTCGDNLTWTLDDAGKLTISGTGPMYNYMSLNAPWYSNRSSIKSVVFGNGVTSIGDWAFSSCSSCRSPTGSDRRCSNPCSSNTQCLLRPIRDLFRNRHGPAPRYDGL